MERPAQTWAGAARHLAWATSLVGCVGLAAVHDWTPFTFRIKNEAVGQPAAAAVATPAFSPEVSRRLILLAEAVEAQERANAAPSPTAELPLQTPTPSQTIQAPTPAAARPVPAPSLPAAQARTAAAAPAPTRVAAGNVAAQGIEDPAVAARVFEVLGRLAAVEDRAGKPEGEPLVYVFFDPRCPYCHAAYKALHGKVAARWIPVVVLGEPDKGRAMARAILGANDPVAALTATFDRTAFSAPPNAELDAKLNENLEAFAAIFQASPGSRPGVPIFMIPRPDGRLTMLVGYEAGDEAKVESVLRGR